jgi:hypothetical protein
MDMIRTVPWLVTVALLLGAALGMNACGSSGGSGTGGHTSTTTTTTGAGGGTPTCMAYCTTIMKNCTGGDGSTPDGGMDPTKTNQQYTAMQNCLNVCALFPVGTAADTSGDTLGCRTYHAGAAAMNATLHCPHAGPGGDGTCGDLCTSYCRIVGKYCTAANMAGPIYTSNADCMAVCKASKSDLRYNIAIQAGDEQACLLYHSQEASVTPPDHCTGDLMKSSPDAGQGSVTCM